MPELAIIPTMADMDVQRPAHPKTAAQARARFFNSANAFTRQLSDVPEAVFIEEPMLAFRRTTPTGLIPCDRAAELGAPMAATSPLMLAQYVRINSSEGLQTSLAASGSLWYVIMGSGSSGDSSESISWAEGDIFVLPGGTHQHRAGKGGAILWMVSNAPQYAFEGITEGAMATPMVHYPAAEIRRQLGLIYQVAMGSEAAAMSIVFSSDRQEANRTALPSLSIDLSSLPAGQSQRPHKHNSVAITLLIQGEKCYSMVGGQRRDWQRWATAVTPPSIAHSVHNEGKVMALSLTVQYAGLHRYARTMGFSFG